MRLGHDVKWLLLIAFNHVDFTGLPHAWCKNLICSAIVDDVDALLTACIFFLNVPDSLLVRSMF